MRTARCHRSCAGANASRTQRRESRTHIALLDKPAVAPGLAMFGKRERVPDCRGFTLLEVILALAVLGLSLVTIGNVTRLSFDNARAASDELEARLVAESVMGEILSGAREMVAASPTPLQAVTGETPRYAFAVEVGDTATPQIRLVRVVVTPFVAGTQAAVDAKPLCAIERWKIDPAYLSQVAAANSL